MSGVLAPAGLPEIHKLNVAQSSAQPVTGFPITCLWSTEVCWGAGEKFVLKKHILAVPVSAMQSLPSPSDALEYLTPFLVGKFNCICHGLVENAIKFKL